MNPPQPADQVLSESSLLTLFSEAYPGYDILSVGHPQFGYSGVAVLFIDTMQGAFVAKFFIQQNDATLLCSAERMVRLQLGLLSDGLPVPRPVSFPVCVNGIPVLLEERIAGEHRLHPSLDEASSIAEFIGRLHLVTGRVSRLANDEYTSRWREKLATISTIIAELSDGGMIDSPKTKQILSDALRSSVCGRQVDGEIHCKVIGFADAVVANNLFERVFYYVSTVETAIIHADELHTSSTHGDASPKNVLFVPGTARIAGVVDYGSHRVTYSLHDLAHALLAWTHPIGGDSRFQSVSVRAMVRQMVTAYNRVRPLSETEQRLLPIFITARFVDYLVDFISLYLQVLRGNVHPRLNFMDPVQLLHTLELFTADENDDPCYRTIFTPELKPLEILRPCDKINERKTKDFTGL